MTTVNLFPYWQLASDLSVVESNDLAKEIATCPIEFLSFSDREKLTLAIAKGDGSMVLPIDLPKSDNVQWYVWKWKKTQHNGIHLTLVDITETKESELFYEQILHASPDLILVKGEKSKIAWANKAFQEYYGLNNSQLKELVDAPNVEPDFTQQYVIDDAWVWKNKEMLTIECEPVTKFDGTIRKFQTIKFPLFNHKNRVIRTVGISRDISDKIESEEKSVTASKMAALGEMAGGIAHEINNPLAIICGHTHLMKHHLKNGTKIFSYEDIISTFQLIEDSSNRISRITRGLVKFSRNADNDPVSKVKIGEVINDTLAFCNANIQKKGIKLDLEINDTEIECRDIQISQIILNLLNNAVDAMQDSPAKWIKITTDINGGSLELRVQDSGPGVPEEISNKIMQPFFTTKEVGKGTGLGLSLSQAIASQHHGALKLDRNISPSCFLLKLPLMQPKAS